MKKLTKYLSFLPFAISIGAIIIYLFYTIKIKLSRRVIITPEFTGMLKTYLIIALVSLLIGLFIILIKKLYYLLKDNSKVKKEKIVNIDKTVIVNNDKFNGVACPECSGTISKNAAICPHCGIMFDKEVVRILNNMIALQPQKIKLKKSALVANILLIIIFLFLTFLVSNLLINKAHENKNNVRPLVINNNLAK